MNEVLHANIFFIIASVATVCFCILVSLILYHVLKIVRSVRVIVKRIEDGSGVIADDVAFVRSFMRGGVANLFGMFGGGKARRKRRGDTMDEESTDDE